jgi:hypothetical protein
MMDMDTEIVWSQLALAYMQAALDRIRAHNQAAWVVQVMTLRTTAEQYAGERQRPYVFAADVVTAYRVLGYGRLTVKIGQTSGKHRGTKKRVH